MKNHTICGALFFVTIIICDPNTCIAQEKEQEPKFVYCQIVGVVNLAMKLTVEVDFGQKMNGWVKSKLRDADGKSIKFNSMVDALNYMGKRGWIFTQAYAIGNGGGGSTYHYLLQKPYEDLDAETKAEFNKDGN